MCIRDSPTSVHLSHTAPSSSLRYTPYKHFICGRQTLTHDREDDVFHWKVSEYGDDDGTGY